MLAEKFEGKLQPLTTETTLDMAQAFFVLFLFLRLGNTFWFFGLPGCQPNKAYPLSIIRCSHKTGVTELIPLVFGGISQ